MAVEYVHDLEVHLDPLDLADAIDEDDRAELETTNLELFNLETLIIVPTTRGTLPWHSIMNASGVEAVRVRERWCTFPDFLSSPNAHWQLKALRFMDQQSSNVVIPPHVFLIPKLREICLMFEHLDLDSDGVFGGDGVMDQNPKIENVYITDSTISHIPSTLCRLTQLKMLLISGSIIKSLPIHEDYHNMESLHTIEISQCNLLSCPELIQCFPNLTNLDLSTNQLNDTSSIPHLPKLKKLVLDENQIEDVPPLSLPLLQTLHMGNNLLCTLPPSLCHLSSLHTLHLDNNKITTVCTEIFLLSNLETLSLRHNALSSLPSSISLLPAITQVDVAYNNLVTLPYTLGNLKHKLCINVTENEDLNELPWQLDGKVELNKWRPHRDIDEDIMSFPISPLQTYAMQAMLKKHGYQATHQLIPHMHLLMEQLNEDECVHCKRIIHGPAYCKVIVVKRQRWLYSYMYCSRECLLHGYKDV